MKWGVLLIFVASLAYAGEQPVLFSRETMRLLPQAEQKLPWQGEPGFALDVEVRPAEALKHGGWFDVSGLSERRGLLVIYDPPQNVQLQSKEVLAPLDILLFNSEGIVVEMMPRIRLADLAQPLESAQPVRAVLYLKSGVAERYKLALGDRALFRAFKKEPVILRSQQPSPPAAVAPAPPSAPVEPVGREPSLDDLLNQQLPEKPKQ